MPSQFVCGRCSKNFVHIQSLRRHLKKSHNNLCVLGHSNITCEQCSKRFPSLKQYIDHLDMDSSNVDLLMNQSRQDTTAVASGPHAPLVDLTNETAGTPVMDERLDWSCTFDDIVGMLPSSGVSPTSTSHVDLASTTANTTPMVTTCTTAASTASDLPRQSSSVVASTSTELTATLSSGVTTTRRCSNERALSPVSDEESSKRERSEYPSPKHLTKIMRIDCRDVRTMIDEVEKKVASNHQEVMSAIKALNPAIRETLDDVSVIQQSYMRDVVATLDSSIDELKKRFKQLENRKKVT